MTRKYNWAASPPDERDMHFKASRPITGLPQAADECRKFLPPAWDQGDIGSCVAHATAAAVLCSDIRNGGFNTMPSRLQIYHDARAMEGTANEDAGCFIRHAFKVMAKSGSADESLWPYDVAKFHKKPPKTFYKAESLVKASRYERVKQSLPELKYALSRGYPVAFGMELKGSFESDEVAKTGHVPIPKSSEEDLGGHAMCIVGYDDAFMSFLVRNSWGTEWGFDGHCWIPYEMVVDPAMSDDFWACWAVTKSLTG